MGLKEYKAKRKFNETPEPEGKVKDRKGVHRFVVQKHAASHLHYDFRLEMDGVLKSWAVPKGPSMNPGDKRLAMMVEDHPMEYGSFEGIIPEGNYGAGTVMLWDEGTYQALNTEGRENNEKELKKGLYSGSLKFVMEGKKLKGEFTLVKLKNSKKGNEWLLIKKRDKYASDEDITKKDKSVVTKRTLDQIKTQSGKGKSVWHSNDKNIEVDLSKGKKARMPHEVKPMLATLVEEPFESSDWLFEIKWDGFRAIAEVDYNNVEIYSRNLISFNQSFPAVAEALQELGQQAVLDGEIVALDENGLSQFQLIQNYQRTGKGQIVYYVFDILYLNGYDLSNLTLLERKEILKKILPKSNVIRYNDHILEKGIDFFEQAKEKGLEGIIGKKRDSTYLFESRSKDWVKVKAEMRQEVVIAGYTEPRGGRKHLGALVLGLYSHGKLVYIGHSGGGFNYKGLQEMYKKLKPLITDKCPFSIKPKTNMPVQWVKPKLVGEVKFQEWTEEGIMRIPIFMGLREDKDSKEVKREMKKDTEEVVSKKVLTKTEKIKNPKTKAASKTSKQREPVSRQGSKKKITRPEVGKTQMDVTENKKEATAKVDGKILKFTNLKKIYWQEEGYTKQDLIEYYDKMAPVILPYLKDRPENLRRNPNGYKGASFFQKDMPDSIPEWIETQKIYSESNEDYVNYMFCQKKADLLYMANLGCIELNPWLSRKDSLEYPDYIVIDLDPKDVPFSQVIEVAQAVKEVLDRADITGYPKTSGSKGIHIYIPMGAKYDYDQGKQFAQLVASLTHQVVPAITSLERMPDKRKNKVYIDYLQNRKGQTLAAPYCVRPKSGATVSAPLKWSEIKEGLELSQFTIRTIFTRIEQVGDIFQPIMNKGINLEKVLKLLVQ